MKLSTGVLELFNLVLKAQFNTEMWGHERDTHNTWHIFCLNFSKTKGTNGYALTVIVLCFSLIVGYRFKESK